MIETPKKWSILIVNYFSSVYIKWQLKILYEFNNVDNFELVIVDNSVDESEKKILQNLTENYQKEYKNINKESKLHSMLNLKAKTKAFVLEMFSVFQKSNKMV